MKHGLVVDHSSAIRKVARRILECFEFEIAETGDIWDALKTCRREMPDLILVDLHIPDAIEFIADVRRMLKGKIPKVITCSIENHIARIGRANRAGANDFILKPFYRETIEAKLRDLGFLKLSPGDRRGSEPQDADYRAPAASTHRQGLAFPLMPNGLQDSPRAPTQ
jgi:two-component system chemotaxis response regulator CheY